MVYVYPELAKAQAKARKLGLEIPVSSQRKNKKLMVVYKGKEIHFGYRTMEDYLQHNDEDRRSAFIKRARCIVDDKGRPFYINKTSPLFWSYHILW